MTYVNYVFFKCLTETDFHIHIFSDPIQACEYLDISISSISSWEKFYKREGLSIYKDIIKGYALVFLEDGTEQDFFDSFSESCNKLTIKLAHIVRPLILKEGGECMYSSVVYGQSVRDKAISFVDWLCGYILKPKSLLLNRGFTLQELYWLQAYVGKRIPTNMPGLSRLKDF